MMRKLGLRAFREPAGIDMAGKWQSWDLKHSRGSWLYSCKDPVRSAVTGSGFLEVLEELS